ncbi:MAG: cytochrome c biogenesis protein CcdA [Acidimicrobiia bacterium]
MRPASGDVRPGRYWGTAALVLVVALAGYTGYVLYPRFNVPAGQGVGLLGLAAAAGVASFFSPCSFPLLLTLLGRHDARAGDAGRPKPVLFGAALALGAAVFMLAVGVVIALGGQTLFTGVTFASPAGVVIRAVVGLVLIVLGLVQAGIVPLSMHGVSRLAQPLLGERVGLRRRPPLRRYVLFGFGYVLAGFG